MAKTLCVWVSLLTVAAVIFLATPANAQITDTELAGRSLSVYPFFEYVKAINENAALEIAIDPTRFPAVAGQTCDIYVVASKSFAQWTADPSLIDVTPGGAQTETVTAGSIQVNRFQVTGPSDLSANAGAGLGVGYDVVLDFDQDGSLSSGDFIDGRSGEAGFYAVHDTTAAGPFPVTAQDYNLDSSVATAFSIPANRRAENLFYPTNIASLGKQPLIVIGHGNGHSYDWYDHIGNHLASYGYIVMSLDNATTNSEGGPSGAASTTLNHTDAFIDQAEAGAIAGGDLTGHIDTSRIVWIGHSRGAEAVAIAYNRLFSGTYTPTHYSKDSIKLISSMLPTDFRATGDIADPHDANYHLWTAAGDTDVRTAAGQECCQTFRIHDRATHFRQATVVQGAGHAWFHNGPTDGGHWDGTQIIDPGYFEGPCSIGPEDPVTGEPTNDLTHRILLGHLLPLVKHYVDGNIPALDFLTRQYESFRPIGVPTGNSCIVVTHQYRNGSPFGNFTIDDYQSGSAEDLSSSGGGVSFTVENLTEGLLDDNNTNFNWPVPPAPPDPFNGALQGTTGDTTRGVVFDWTGDDRFYEWAVPAAGRDFSNFQFLSFRAAQGTQHPNTLAAVEDLTFNVTLRDGSSPTGTTSTINIGAYGGGLEEPYARADGGHNEMETIRIRISDFRNNSSGIDLTDIVAVRLDFGPSHGSTSGRIVLDDLMVTNDIAPQAFEIIEPTTARPAYAGTSTTGSRVLVRLIGLGGLDLSPGNLTISVDGTPLTPAQIPTAAADVGGETWVVIAPGAKANGCYDLAVSLTTPAGVADTETQSLCYNDAETRVFDRVLAVDQTNSMNYDGTTGVSDSAKMEAARAAASFFVDLSNPDDKIGVISFQRRDQDDDGSIVEPDELAETKFSLVTAGEGITDQRPAARTAISLIEPDTSPGFTGPETSPGAALEDARAMLNSSGVTGHEPNIVLLTDGLENYPPFWSQGGSPLRPSFVADDIRIDTVGIGGDADDEILEDIADATGGEFRNLNEGSGSFFLLSRLANWYKAIDEDVRGEQRFYYAEGFPEPSVEISHRLPRAVPFTVEPHLDWMTVAFHTNINNAATVALFQPGNTTPITVLPPSVTLRSDPKHSVYRILKPKAGVWHYTVQPKVPTAEFFAVASGPTLLAARVGPSQLQKRPAGDYSMPLRVWIADEKAVSSASVTGFVRRPDGVKDSLSLLDNGASFDGAGNDGIYGREYIASVPGAYYVQLKATGKSSVGEPFERYLTTAFVLPGQEKKPEQFGEGLPPHGATPSDGFNYQYVAKFVIGRAVSKSHAAGIYFTSVNVHNPNRERVNFRKKFAIALGGEREGPVTDYVNTKLGPDGAFEIDSPDIIEHTRTKDSFVTGFVVIESPAPLDVVAVYTVAGRDKFVQGLEVETILPRQIRGCPDLVVDKIQRPIWDAAARQSVIRAAIKNIGNAPAPATQARLVDPSSPQPSGQPYDDVAHTPALVPGEANFVEFRLPFWVYNPDVSLEVTADYKSELNECSEANNLAKFEGSG